MGASPSHQASQSNEFKYKVIPPGSTNYEVLLKEGALDTLQAGDLVLVSDPRLKNLQKHHNSPWTDVALVYRPDRFFLKDSILELQGIHKTRANRTHKHPHKTPSIATLSPPCTPADNIILLTVGPSGFPSGHSAIGLIKALFNPLHSPGPDVILGTRLLLLRRGPTFLSKFQSVWKRLASKRYILRHGNQSTQPNSFGASASFVAEFLSSLNLLQQPPIPGPPPSPPDFGSTAPRPIVSPRIYSYELCFVNTRRLRISSLDQPMLPTPNPTVSDSFDVSQIIQPLHPCIASRDPEEMGAIPWCSVTNTPQSDTSTSQSSPCPTHSRPHTPSRHSRPTSPTIPLSSAPCATGASPDQTTGALPSPQHSLYTPTPPRSSPAPSAPPPPFAPHHLHPPATPTHPQSDQGPSPPSLEQSRFASGTPQTPGQTPTPPGASPFAGRVPQHPMIPNHHHTPRPSPVPAHHQSNVPMYKPSVPVPSRSRTPHRRTTSTPFRLPFISRFLHSNKTRTRTASYGALTPHAHRHGLYTASQPHQTQPTSHPTPTATPSPRPMPQPTPRPTHSPPPTARRHQQSFLSRWFQSRTPGRKSPSNRPRYYSPQPHPHNPQPYLSHRPVGSHTQSSPAIQPYNTRSPVHTAYSLKPSRATPYAHPPSQPQPSPSWPPQQAPHVSPYAPIDNRGFSAPVLPPSQPRPPEYMSQW